MVGGRACRNNDPHRNVQMDKKIVEIDGIISGNLKMNSVSAREFPRGLDK